MLKDRVGLFGNIDITWCFTWMFWLRCASPEGPMFFWIHFECYIKTPVQTTQVLAWSPAHKHILELTDSSVPRGSPRPPT